MGYTLFMAGMRPMTDAEITRVLAELEPRDHCLFVLGIRTGFRISELLSINIKDVLQGGEIQPTVVVRRKNMKGKRSSREATLHPAARTELASWTAVLTARGAAPESPLFPTPAGTAVTRSGAYKILTRAYRRAGVFGRLGTHSMRKRFASVMHKHFNKDLFKVQKMMGHASVSSTASYMSFTDDEITAAFLAEDTPM